LGIHKLQTLVRALQRLEDDERTVILEAIKRGREALSVAQSQCTLQAMMGAAGIASASETKRNK
jgi:hypothetical protein